MRDLNFFSESLKARRSVQSKRTAITIVILGLVLIIGGAYTFTELTAFALRADIAQMDRYVKSDEVISKQKDIKDKKERLALMQKYAAAVDTVIVDFSASNIMKGKLLEDINKTLPAGAFFSNIDFSGGKLILKGFSDSRTSIAELAHNLKLSGYFGSVRIVNIGKKDETNIDEKTVNFEIAGSFEGGKD